MLLLLLLRCVAHICTLFVLQCPLLQSLLVPTASLFWFLSNFPASPPSCSCSEFPLSVRKFPIVIFDLPNPFLWGRSFLHVCGIAFALLVLWLQFDSSRAFTPFVFVYALSNFYLPLSFFEALPLARFSCLPCRLLSARCLVQKHTILCLFFVYFSVWPVLFALLCIFLSMLLFGNSTLCFIFVSAGSSTDSLLQAWVPKNLLQ